MDSKIIKYFLSFILSITLFVIEVLFMVQYNLSRGIKEKNINNIVDSINIENEIIETKEYKDLEEKINYDVLQEIIESKELEYYIKENIKSLSSNILYNRNNPYVESDELKQYVNRKVEEKQVEIGITEEEKLLINQKVDYMTKKVDDAIEKVETYRYDMIIISSFLSTKTTTILLGITIAICAIIVLINKSKDAYMFVGFTTLIVGVIFFILWLALSKTINVTGIDKDVMIYTHKYLPELLNILKKSSIIMTVLGATGCATYTIMNYQEVQANGKI